jgi:hypothetical protein
VAREVAFISTEYGFNQDYIMAFMGPQYLGFLPTLSIKKY